MIIEGNKKSIAIVVIGYNRLGPIKRLLASLDRAHYSMPDVPLVISIDASGNEELYDYVRNFEWKYGNKYVNIQQSRLGLQKHIYQCADLSKHFKAVILLEDDCYVSECFYDYALSAVDTYGECEVVAEIALFKNETNGYIGLPFTYMFNGSDTFLGQDVCTSGEVFTERMWRGFQNWLQRIDRPELSDIQMPSAIKRWTRAWSTMFNAYVVDTDKYVVYPHFAVSTNFNDFGEHKSGDPSLTQVNLSHCVRPFVMYDVDKLFKYDIFGNNVGLYDWLRMSRKELCLDLYGLQVAPYNNCRYILSTRKKPYEVVKSFGLCMRPIEMNVKENIEGEGIFLYDTTKSKGKERRGHFTRQLAKYFIVDFNYRILIPEILYFYWRRLLVHLKMKK